MGGFFFTLAQNIDTMNEIVHPKGKLYYSMGEVCEIYNVKPSLIRFWEDNFSILKPHRNSKGNRLFTPSDVDNIGLIYHLVKESGMTLAGAEKKIMQDKRNKGKLNRKVEIIEHLQKIRNLLREVRDDIDNDSVVARFDDDEPAEPVAEAKTAVEMEPVPAEPEPPVTNPAAASEENGELQESVASKTNPADKEQNTEQQADGQVVKEKKIRTRKGVTKTPHKGKVTLFEPRLDLFSELEMQKEVIDVVEVQQSTSADEARKDVVETVSPEKLVEPAEDVDIEEPEKPELPHHVTVRPEKDGEMEQVETSRESAETGMDEEKAEEKGEMEQITQIFF